jgi:phosphodiester glycosidase
MIKFGNKIFIFLIFAAISCLALLSAKKSSTTFEIVTEKQLDQGLVYKNILYGKGRNKHSLHVIEADLMNPSISVEVFKSGDNVHSLSKLQHIISRSDSLNGDDKNILGASNANFWKAYSNRPIGPTVINGIPLEIRRYKKWSSIFFNEMSMPTIDTFTLKGTISYYGEKFKIEYVNRRRDSNDLVLYNQYAGDTIPYIMNRLIEKEFNQMLKDTVFNDSTEIELNIDEFKYLINEEKRQANKEFAITKIVLEYIDIPRINHPTKCKVIAIKKGKVAVPKNGCIVSVGANFVSRLPEIGETATILFETNVNKDTEFWDAVSGTPRLVRNGKAKHEAYKEGSKGRRFIRRGLARTAIGTDQYGQKIYLVTVEHSQSSKRKKGATLANMASIMKAIGCYNAMNLDGGGSSIMVIDSANVMRASRPNYSRKISVGIGFEKRKLTIQNIMK